MSEILYRFSYIAFYFGVSLVVAALAGQPVSSAVLYVFFAVFLDMAAKQRIDTQLIIMQMSRQREEASDIDNSDNNEGMDQ